MPGRGQPWKGVGFGVPDRIGTEGIKDGSITEADLDSNVTSKLNSGGYDTVEEEGSPLTQRSELNFVGAGVVASDDGEKTVVTIAGGGAGHTIEDEGSPLATQPDLNFVGAGVTATNDGENTATVITVPIQPAYDTIQEEGTPLTQRPTIDFVGAGVVATDDSENTKTVVTIAGGGGGITRELVANPATDLYLYDEFFYPTPSTYLDVHYEKAGSFSAVVDAIGGQVQFQTTAVANNVARINTCGGGLLAIDVTKNWRFAVRLRQQTVTSNTAMLISIYQNDGSPPGGTFPFATNTVTSIEIRADGTGNYFATTDNNSTPNSQDTGVTIDTSFHTFEIRSNPSTPSIEFLIDENVVATFTTNLPTGSKSVFIGVQTGTTAFARANVDTLFLYQDR